MKKDFLDKAVEIYFKNGVEISDIHPDRSDYCATVCVPASKSEFFDALQTEVYFKPKLEDFLDKVENLFFPDNEDELVRDHLRKDDTLLDNSLYHLLQAAAGAIRCFEDMTYEASRAVKKELYREKEQSR